MLVALLEVACESAAPLGPPQGLSQTDEGAEEEFEESTRNCSKPINVEVFPASWSNGASTCKGNTVFIATRLL